MESSSPVVSRLRIVCVGTGRDGTQTLNYFMQRLFDSSGGGRSRHEYHGRDINHAFSEHKETQSPEALAALKGFVANCDYDCIVGNGYAAILPLFTAAHGRGLKLLHLRRADRAACVASLVRNCLMFPTAYGYYAADPQATVKRLSAFHFGEMTRAEWDRLSLEEKFGWYYDKTHALIDQHRSLFDEHIEVHTEDLDSEAALQRIARFAIGANAVAPRAAHLNASAIDIASFAPEHQHRMRWLMGRLDLNETARDDVYAMDYFVDKFVAWIGYQLNNAPQLAPASAPPAEQIAANLDRGLQILKKGLRDLEGLREMPAGGEPAAPAPMPVAMPQAMVRLMLAEFSSPVTLAAVDAAIAKALAVQGEQGSRAANRFLLRQIGIEPLPNRDEAYYAEALHYLVGSLRAYAGQPDEMAEHLGLSLTMPGGDDEYLYSDHVNQSKVLKAAQLNGIERGVPPILIACMPRSASATLTHSLAQALRIPVLRLSLGRFPSCFLVPRWLDMFLEGGAITQDHFGAIDFNLGILNARGSRDLFVLARDPRAAARSQVHYLERDPSEPLEAAIERECIVNFIPWLQGWLDCAHNPEVPFRIHWITYKEVCRDRAAVLRRISTVLHRDYPAMAAYAECQAIPEVNIHFETGDDDAWRAEIGQAARIRLWRACSPQIRALLGLES
jgi:hypothetical protein